MKGDARPCRRSELLACAESHGSGGGAGARGGKAGRTKSKPGDGSCERERGAPDSRRKTTRSRWLREMAMRNRPQGVKRRKATGGTPDTLMKVEDGTRAAYREERKVKGWDMPTERLCRARKRPGRELRRRWRMLRGA